MANSFRPPLSRPQRHLGRMAVFLILAGFVAVILQKQIMFAFMANPALNALIVGVMFIGIILALRQVIRLFPEIRWVNHLANSSNEKPFVSPAPTLLAPMAALLSNHTHNQPLSVSMTRSLLDSVGSRLDEGREIVRYIAGLLIFLGLLGTFWGLIDTVGSVGKIISSLSTGGDAVSLFDSLKTALSEPLQGMGLSFSASLFGLAGSLIIGFLDLQAGQAQNLFYNELEDWLSSATADAEHIRPDYSVNQDLNRNLERLISLLSDSADHASSSSDQSLIHVAADIKTLAQVIRSDQQLLRGWMETQIERDKDLRVLINVLARQEKN